MIFRKRIFKIIQPAEEGDVLSFAFDVAISLLVFISVFSVFVGTFDLPKGWECAFDRLEIGVSILFSIEYLLRLITSDLLYPGLPKWRSLFKYMVSGMAIVDLLAILPFYLPMLFPGEIMVVRLFRLVRMFRIFKLNRYFDSLSAIAQVIKSKSHELLGSMLIVGVLLVTSSLFIYAAEHDAQPESFKNAFSGLWWAVATLTTVGYGDIYPITALGRLVGAVIAILGIGMVAIPTGIISSGLIDHINNQKRDMGEESDSDSTDSECERCPHCGKKINKVR